MNLLKSGILQTNSKMQKFYKKIITAALFKHFCVKNRSKTEKDVFLHFMLNRIKMKASNFNGCGTHVKPYSRSCEVKKMSERRD